MKLVDNWMRTHRKYSAQAMATAIAIEGAWQTFSGTTLAASLPPAAPKYVGYVVMGLLALGIFGSMVDQGAITDPTPPEEPKP